MKKLFLLFGFALLLVGCEETAPVVEIPSEDLVIEEPSEKVMAPQPFYIADIYVSDGGINKGEQYLEADPVVWLSASDGECTNMHDSEATGLPECNPNGFLIVNERNSDIIHYWIPEGTPVYAQNLTVRLGMEYVGPTEEGTLISFEDLLTAFENTPDFFEGTPFELEYGTVMVDGQEMSDQIISIKERYIP